MSVVDASVWVSALVPGERHHPVSRAWLASRLPSGDGLVIPTLLLGELAGALARRTGRPEMGTRAVAQVLRADAIRILSLDPAMGRDAADVAAQLRIRGADAVYVVAARTLGVPLITWDNEIHERARSLIEVLEPTL